jgi:hypothetical protein
VNPPSAEGATLCSPARKRCAKSTSPVTAALSENASADSPWRFQVNGPSAEGAELRSPARERWESMSNIHEPRQRAALSEHRFRIEVHPVFPKQRDEFIFKGKFSMMSFLVANIPANRREV